MKPENPLQSIFTNINPSLHSDCLLFKTEKVLIVDELYFYDNALNLLNMQVLYFFWSYLLNIYFSVIC